MDYTGGFKTYTDGVLGGIEGKEFLRFKNVVFGLSLHGMVGRWVEDRGNGTGGEFRAKMELGRASVMCDG